MNARISSCGNMRTISSRLGGWNGAVSGGADVSGAAPCLSRHAGQSPPRAPVGSVAPHCGHLFSILGSSSGSFILLPQKQNPENVTRFRWKSSRILTQVPRRCDDFFQGIEAASACLKDLSPIPSPSRTALKVNFCRARNKSLQKLIHHLAFGTVCSANNFLHGHDSSLALIGCDAISAIISPRFFGE